VPQPRVKTSKQAFAHVQRMCCLGIGGEMLMPDLMRALTELIPSRQGLFFWVGPNLEVTNSYNTFSASLLDLYFKEFHNTPREYDFLKPVSSIATWSPRTPVHQLGDHLCVDQTTFQRSDFYNAIWRTAEVYQPLSVRVREAGRNLGVLHIYRAAGEVAFGPDDLKILASIASFVAHGLTRPALGEDAFAGRDDYALFVADREGIVRHADFRARLMLEMALNPRFVPTTPLRGPHNPVPEIVCLCRTLAATANGHIGQPPPVLRLRNPWGEFVLRAYWLGPTNGAEQTSQVGITIERRVPLALALLRRVEDLPLTAREKHLCLLLARGLSVPDLAAAMGLTASTVISHQRSIHAKLGVHSRVELLATLQTRCRDLTISTNGRRSLQAGSG
jgi:DNA-binding CsgD family transcriptional regulator